VKFPVRDQENRHSTINARNWSQLLTFLTNRQVQVFRIVIFKAKCSLIGEKGGRKGEGGTHWVMGIGLRPWRSKFFGLVIFMLLFTQCISVSAK
jgi:hypothetical protein